MSSSQSAAPSFTPVACDRLITRGRGGLSVLPRTIRPHAYRSAKRISQSTLSLELGDLPRAQGLGERLYDCAVTHRHQRIVLIMIDRPPIAHEPDRLN